MLCGVFLRNIFLRLLIPFSAFLICYNVNKIFLTVSVTLGVLTKFTSQIQALKINLIGWEINFESCKECLDNLFS